MTECYFSECIYHESNADECYFPECKNDILKEEVEKARVVFEKLRKLCLDFEAVS